MLAIKLVLIISFSSILLTAQERVVLPLDAESYVVYEEAIEVKEASKSELFLRAKKWFNSHFVNPKNVIKKQDPTEGVIKGIHKFRIYKKNEFGKEYMAGFVNYTVLIFAKEGRFKYLIKKFNKADSFYHPIERWIDTANPIEQDWLRQVDEFAKELIDKIKENMQTPTRIKGLEDAW